MNNQQSQVKHQPTMSEQQQQVWRLARRLTSATVLLGIAAFIASFVVNGVIRDYLLYGGIGLVVAACFLFALGLVFMLMQEATSGQVALEEDVQGAAPIR